MAEIRRGIDAKPECWLKLENYQEVVTTTVNEYDDGSKTESTSRSREISSTHTEKLDIHEWNDDSDPISELNRLETYPVVALRTFKKISMADSARGRVERAKDRMTQRNGEWGKEKVFSEELEFDYKPKKYTLIINDSMMDTRPWYLNKDN